MIGAGFLYFFLIDETMAPPESNTTGHGFFMGMVFQPEEIQKRFPSETPLPICTIYYRFKGVQGDTTTLSFCDATLATWAARCLFNALIVYSDPQGINYNAAELTTYYISSSHRPGLLTVREGPATQTERPPAPPEAQVYPRLPSPEEVNFRVRIEGASVSPGDREVPVEVYLAADLEYTAVMVPIDYDERYLRLARAEDHFLSGNTRINDRDEIPGSNPEEGNVLILSSLAIGKRRIAPAGAEVHAATLYFDVLPAAADVEETSLEVTKIRSVERVSYEAWVGIRQLEGVPGGGYVEVRSEVMPVSIVPGRLALRRERPARRGDADRSGEVDLTDAVGILKHLFLGAGELACPGAADLDLDGVLDLTDPILLLGSLYLGSPSLSELEPAEVPCR